MRDDKPASSNGSIKTSDSVINNTDIVISNPKTGQLCPYYVTELIEIEYEEYFYKSLYDDSFIFDSLSIKFAVGSSKQSEKAVFVCSRLPKYKVNDSERAVHSCTIISPADLCKYSNALDSLLYLICDWRSTEIFINNELVRYRDYRDMMWLMKKRQKRLRIPCIKCELYDVSQEYYNIYHKLLLD